MEGLSLVTSQSPKFMQFLSFVKDLLIWKVLGRVRGPKKDTDVTCADSIPKWSQPPALGQAEVRS